MVSSYPLSSWGFHPELYFGGFRIHSNNIVSLLHGITSICPAPEQSSKSNKNRSAHAHPAFLSCSKRNGSHFCQRIRMSQKRAISIYPHKGKARIRAREKSPWEGPGSGTEEVPTELPAVAGRAGEELPASQGGLQIATGEELPASQGGLQIATSEGLPASHGGSQIATSEGLPASHGGSQIATGEGLPASHGGSQIATGEGLPASHGGSQITGESQERTSTQDEVNTEIWD